MTEDADLDAVTQELTEFELVKVRMVLGLLHLRAGDVLEVPDKLAELWTTARIAISLEGDDPTTAKLSDQDLAKISFGLDIA